MKGIIIVVISSFILCVVCLVSCGPSAEEIAAQKKNGGYLVTEGDIKIYKYQGCSYIRFGYGESCFGSHMGNCPNPIHKYMHPDSVITQ